MERSCKLFPNRPLSEVLQRHLDRVGPPHFDDKERSFAARTQANFEEPPDQPLADAVDPLPDEPWHVRASTDVGNVSWAVPTGGIDVACCTRGAPGHSWQVVACIGMSIGERGMLVAARTLAGATLELLAHPKLVEAAQRDFDARRASKPNTGSGSDGAGHDPLRIAEGRQSARAGMVVRRRHGRWSFSARSRSPRASARFPCRWSTAARFCRMTGSFG